MIHLLQVDKKVIEKLAKNEATEKDSLLKICCDKPKKAEEDTTKQNISDLINVTSTETAPGECLGNCSLDTSANLTTTETVPVECLEKCKSKCLLMETSLPILVTTYSMCQTGLFFQE